jgi:hypothetical protein
MTRLPEPAAGEPAPAGAARAALVLLFIAEAFAFCVTARRNVAWIYPRWYDQQQYLGEAYGAFGAASQGGFMAGVAHAIGHGAPQGCLQPVLALLSFEAFGPSREAALAVNLALFLLLQAATFAAARRISGSAALPWAAVAFLMALAAPWSAGPGSAFDFRLDWPGACAFGICLAMAIGGGAFGSVRTAAALGAAAGACILLRYITAAYFGAAFAVLLLWAAARPGGRRRCLLLALSAGIGLAICAPVLWLGRRAIYEYYWLGHIAGPERVLRDSHLGAAASVAWILREVLLVQVGLPAACLAAALAAALFFLGRAESTREPYAPAPPARLADAWALALAFLVAPAAVLAFQPQKAAQTMGIFIPGTAWAAVLAWTAWSRRVRRAAVAAACACAFLAGAGLFARTLARSAPPAGLEREYRHLNALGDFLYFRSQEAGLDGPSIAVGWLHDGLRAEAFSLAGLERHGTGIGFAATLPTGLFDADRASVMAALAGSDFVCLVTRAQPLWPFDREMDAMTPDMRRWCDAHLEKAGQLEEPEFSAAVYESRSLRRPAGGVTLGRLLEASEQGRAYARVQPPAPPLFPQEATVPAQAGSEVAYAMGAAYGPVHYTAEGLPAGLELDAATGALHGQVSKPGLYLIDVSAANAEGTTSEELRLDVGEEPLSAVVRPSLECRAGAEAVIGFRGYDASGNMRFVDVTDLTAGRPLGRVEAPAGRGRRWDGDVRARFPLAGQRTLLMRFVSVDAAGRGRTSFIDRRIQLSVDP